VGTAKGILRPTVGGLPPLRDNHTVSSLTFNHGIKMKNNEKPVVIVTGASSGIGLGLSLTLLEKGFRVVGTSRTISKSKDLAASSDLILIDGDSGKKETAIQVAESAIKHFGRIDLLVNNAGIFVPKPFTDYTEEDFTNMVTVNVASFFFMSQQVIPQMKKQKSGHIVNIATTLAEHPVPGMALQILTKSTMPAVSRALALEYAADGIRINTVSPGVIDTPMHANHDHEVLKKSHPIQRLGQISEIVRSHLNHCF
jgi:NAD(P)-dependent dehydrogenase (short-subunit alcohol dehydrogenase family)